MPVEMLTYAELGERLKVSPEAARALVKRHRWPRSRANDGKTLVQVDLSEFSHSPISRPPQAQADHQVVAALKQHIETLQTELTEMNVPPLCHVRCSALVSPTWFSAKSRYGSPPPRNTICLSWFGARWK